ncbi:MAG: DUF3426 domain-containing protein [Syntrophales bacterium]|nr:DUF3426 domain-containing protein [Syntrophales bacterium]
MIIECEKCGTKYRFDESLIVGEGARVRCSRCKNVFFQENPSRERVAPPVEVMEEKESSRAEIEEETAEQEIEKEFPDFDDLLEEKEPVDIEIEETAEQEIEKEFPDFDDLLEEKELVDTEMEGDKEREKTKKHLWAPGKVLAYIVIVILVLGGVYMYLFPQMGKEVLDQVSRYMSTDTPEKKDKSIDVKVGSVNFVDVKERLIKNFILGDILVIQGTVVNKYEHSISKVKVRGKILNAAKEVLDEVEFYCGNLLTDEELGHLTGKEIAEELSIQIGSDISNDNIAPEGEIPFMIVFTNPPKEAVEFIVEQVIFD